MTQNEITSTGEIAEREWNGHSESSEVGTDAVATREAEGRGIEFHVSMRDYTQRDMEGLIIEAAAALIVGRHNECSLAKAIEAKCIEQIDARACELLTKVTAEIIDQPLTPAFGDKKPVTMRELIGLTGREYLQTKVGGDGKPSDGRWGSSGSTRIEWIVTQYMTSTFEREIKAATTAAIAEVRHRIEAEHKALIETEKRRFNDAITKAIS